MADAHLLRAVTIVVAGAVAIGVTTRFRLPAVLGYLAVGVIIGPYALSLFELDADTRFLAELGVIFLMFTAGLEFSLQHLVKASADVLWGGFLQVALTGALVFLGATAAGLPAATAIILGGVVAMSSTAITHKQLADQHDLGAPYGRIAIAILLFQDFAALPFLVFVGAWRDGGSPSLIQIAGQFAISAGLLLALTLVFRPFFRRTLRGVARTHSPDLFLLTALALALGAALAANAAGLAAAIGAFLAGMIVGESEFRHRIEDDIRPFRDFLVGLFFITVGMTMDLKSLTTTPLAVGGWILAFLIGKPLVILAVGAIRRWSWPATARVAITLAHGGEFGLLLLTLAMTGNVISAEIGQPLLVALTLTMAFAPILIQKSGGAARWFESAAHRAKQSADMASMAAATSHLDNHVILCGCGRVGRPVARALETAAEPYIAIEIDHDRYETAKRLGCKVVFGDAGSKQLLVALGARRARTIAVTFDQEKLVKRVLNHVRSENSKVRSIVSVTDEREAQAIRANDPDKVFLENLAAGAGLARELLVLHGLSPAGAAAMISRTHFPTESEINGSQGGRRSSAQARKTVRQ